MCVLIYYKLLQCFSQRHRLIIIYTVSTGIHWTSLQSKLTISNVVKRVQLLEIIQVIETLTCIELYSCWWKFFPHSFHSVSFLVWLLFLENLFLCMLYKHGYFSSFMVKLRPETLQKIPGTQNEKFKKKLKANNQETWHFQIWLISFIIYWFHFHSCR